MSDESTGTATTDGTTDTGSASQTTGTAPDTSGSGQPDGAAAASQTATGSTGPDGDDTFFDPKSIQDKPELVTAYKQMQRAFTKKMQGIKDRASKADAYDRFNADPIGNMQAMAQRLGYTLTRAEAAQQLKAQQGGQQASEPWEPKSWDDVMAMAEQRAEQRIMQRFAPVIAEVQATKRSAIERQLNEIDPTWHEYEDDMKANLRAHPTLAQDPAKLYRLSVPSEVLESRAVQAALKKMEQKTNAAKMAGASSTNKKQLTSMPDGPVTFAQAVEIAKAKMAEQGLRP